MISRIIKVEVRVISRSRRLRLITLTEQASYALKESSLFKRSGRVEFVEEFDRKITRERERR